MFCQTGFYARLGVSPAKWNLDRNPDINFESIAGTKIWIKPDRFSSDFGLTVHYSGSLGYQAKKGFAELGIKGDGALTSYKCGYTYYDAFSNTYISSYVSSKISWPQRVFFLKLGLKIFEKDSCKIFKKLKYSCFISGSIEGKKSITGGISATEINYSPDGINTVNITGSTYSYFSNIYCASFGFMFLLNTVKNKNICNINVYYIMRSKQAQTTTVFQVKDVDKKNYIAGGFDSYGAGLVVELSKNLYWSNFFKKKRKD
jgi:hypothetical protein